MKVTSKGQVTIPQSIRERTGITSGTEVEFTVEDDAVIIRKGNRAEQIDQWLNSVVGTSNTGLTTDEIMEMTRGES